MKKHLESFHEQKKWPCDQCSYKATEKGSMKVHNDSVHLKIKYYCDQCDHKAAGKGLLRQHVETKHLGIAYQCSECDFIASSKPYLYLHSSKKHKKKGRVCEPCGAEFKRRTSINFHHCKPGNFLKINNDNHQAQSLQPVKYETDIVGGKEEKKRKRKPRRPNGSDLKKSKSGKLERPWSEIKEEGNQKFLENIVKMKFKIPESIEIKFAPKCDIAADTRNDELSPKAVNTGYIIDPTGKDTIIKEEENSFSFVEMNHEDSRNSEAVIGDFFFETSEVVERAGDGEMDDYDFESIRPDMFGRKVELEAEKFDFEIVEKVIVEREEERGRRRRG